MSHSFTYDYIITGAGCAGLSLIMHLLCSGKFANKKILLIDKEIKNENDRTWCFWEEEDGLFQPIVYKEWKKLWLHSGDVSKQLTIEPYTYKLIRGIDFYTYCFQQIAHHPNITFLQASIEKIESEKHAAFVLADGKKYTAQYIFNSVLKERPTLKPHQYWLLQHFKGWLVETAQPVFDPSVATLMDFRVGQDQGTTFFYVLPYSENKALVEYTIFSPHLLADGVYEKALKEYIGKWLNVPLYTIKEKEFGVIPMSNYPFPSHHQNIVHMGTAGGQTKASSGFTFRFIQKQSAAIVQNLIAAEQPWAGNDKKRFHFYDSVLLNILYYNKMRGDVIFTKLFSKNKPSVVLKFLDNETKFHEELKIISSLPTGVFLKAALRQITHIV